jgi:hypothetical protein
MLTKILIPTVALLALAGAACRQPDTVPVETTAIPAATRLASSVHAADPNGAPQLAEGFHSVEQNAWRWTAKRFVVLLGPPEGSAERGATLIFRFSIPDAIISQLGELTLTAKVGGATLPAQTYSQPGDYIYSQSVPGAALAGDSVSAEFSFDKALGPSDADQRELSAIFSSVALELR